MNTVPDLLSYACSHFPQRPAVVTENRQLTFAEVNHRANQLVRLFADFGLKPGDCVALLAKNEPEYFELQVATMRSGLTLLPMNFRLAVPELEYIVSDARPALLVCGSEFVDTGRQLDVKNGIALGEEYEKLLAKMSGEDSLARVLREEDAFALLYTSGTTGRPKGALITNRALYSRINSFIFELRIRSDDRFLQCLQFFHIACITSLAYTYVGSTNIVVKNYDPVEALKLISAHRISVVLWVPTMINQIVNLPDVDKVDFSSLQLVHYGGSPIPPVALSKAIELMRCGFIQTYGMTETSTITFLRPADHDPEIHPARLSSAGTVALGMELRVVDDSDRDVGRGEVGEIICRGANVIDAYLNKPEATAEAVKNGWMHTGDLGYQDDDGFLFVTDRKKDMIVSGGENVYPREVEDVLHEHPDVLEAAVIGVPDEKWGERVHAVLVARNGVELDPDRVLAYARSRLAGYKVPKSSQLVNELPKNATGKVVKTVLREPWWKGRTSNVS